MSKRERIPAKEGQYNCGFCLESSQRVKPCDMCLLPSITKSLFDIADKVDDIDNKLRN